VQIQKIKVSGQFRKNISKTLISKSRQGVVVCAVIPAIQGVQVLPWAKARPYLKINNDYLSPHIYYEIIER
jgi:hypothetical protein